MRQITTRYDGECRKCGAEIEAGATVVYEKRVGIFCLGCGPTDPEEIRVYRQEGADRRADRYEEWAEKRREKANAVFKSHEPYTKCHAFNTQPGHIPARARIIKQEDKQYESLRVAQRMEEKAQSLRKVRVKGDANRRQEAYRDAIKARLKPGVKVSSGFFGEGNVVKVFKKSARVEWNRGFTNTSDILHMQLAEGGCHV